MKKHISTSEVEMEFEIEPNALRIAVKVVDAEVFPPLDSENSAKMSRFAHQLNGAILNALSGRMYHATPPDAVPESSGIMQVRQGETLQCPRCGQRMHYSEPCCGTNISQAICSNRECNWRQPVQVLK